MNDLLGKELKHVLADSYALYLKTQNYHWNVEGEHFFTIHTMLESQYKDLATAIDEIAELIRTLGVKAPGNFAFYQSVTKIKDANENDDATTMLTNLCNDQDIILSTLNNAMVQSQKLGDEVVVDYLISRMAVHRKNKWMLISLLKK